ncbi:hypothetical protein HS088_TW13G01588 [Tripterygium wilfordii]|uniref:Uncharacterized protein n=1 Tax=Tripterygium wilfordii TaxID=458696 RepID=A0A7J7CX53_TRIWF|nr:hypothetical protein HS088_TW13G01588 [Tripterygium wilfordii]
MFTPKTTLEKPFNGSSEPAAAAVAASASSSSHEVQALLQRNTSQSALLPPSQPFNTTTCDPAKQISPIQETTPIQSNNSNSSTTWVETSSHDLIHHEESFFFSNAVLASLEVVHMIIASLLRLVLSTPSPDIVTNVPYNASSTSTNFPNYSLYEVNNNGYCGDEQYYNSCDLYSAISNNQVMVEDGGSMDVMYPTTVVDNAGFGSSLPGFGDQGIDFGYSLF